MSSSSVSFKCYYGNEIRRINLAAGQIAYPHLVEQLQESFSIAPTQQLRLRWLDDEGDKVSLTTSDELLDAVRCLADKPDKQPGQAVRIFVTPADQTEVHEGVTCDGCGCGVAGHRFKCMLCPDYDLCSACVSANTHNQHPMILIRRSGDRPAPPFAGCGGRWGGRGGGCGFGRGGGGFGRGGSFGPRFHDFVARAAADVAAAAEAAAAAAAGAAADSNNANGDATAAPKPDPSQPPPPAPAATAAATEEAMATETGGCHDNGSPDPRVARALEHMRAMGFSDDGGWLTRLLVAKEGDISAVLDAIRPAPK